MSWVCIYTTKEYFQSRSGFVIETLLISDTDFQVNKKMYVSLPSFRHIIKLFLICKGKAHVLLVYPQPSIPVSQRTPPYIAWGMFLWVCHTLFAAALTYSRSWVRECLGWSYSSFCIMNIVLLEKGYSLNCLVLPKVEMRLESERNKK